MSISQLLEVLKDPSSVLTIGEKLIVGFSVALLSMSVVFIVLIIIALIIKLLQREKSKERVLNIPSDENLNINPEDNKIDDTKELVAVITSAILASRENKANNIVVRKISRTNNSKSIWESTSNKR